MFLLLQNIFCAQHLKGYAGTSAVYAVAKVDAALQQLGIDDLAERRAHIGAHFPLAACTVSTRGWTGVCPPCPAQPAISLGRGAVLHHVSSQEAAPAAWHGTRAQACTAAAGPLAGTHAHELMSITAQLMAEGDDKAGHAQGSGPLALSALLAHIMFLRANGGLSSATALCDTFGTSAFVSAAMACAVPEQFRQDMRAVYPGEAAIPEGTCADGFPASTLLPAWPHVKDRPGVW